VMQPPPVERPWVVLLQVMQPPPVERPWVVLLQVMQPPPVERLWVVLLQVMQPLPVERPWVVLLQVMQPPPVERPWVVLLQVMQPPVAPLAEWLPVELAQLPVRAPVRAPAWLLPLGRGEPSRSFLPPKPSQWVKALPSQDALPHPRLDKVHTAARLY
jgi:hypothetical protein